MTNETPRRCVECNEKLTPEERRYYENRCEHCERDWLEQMQAAQRPEPITRQ